MELYYTIYFILLLSLFFELANFKVKKGVMILWCIFFILFGGLRWNVGGDWDQYHDHFLFSSWSNIFNYDRYGNGDEKLEPGFVFFNVLIKTIFQKFWIYNIIVVSIIEYAYYKFCIYFCPEHPLVPFVMVNMSVLFPVRAGLSMAFVYMAYKYIKERNLKMFLVFTLIGTALHNQCIVILPLYWIGHVKLKDWMLLILYIVFAFSTYMLQDYFISLMLMFGGSIADKALGYTMNETEGFKGASYIGWVLNFFFLLIYLYVAKKEKSRQTYWTNTLINGFLLYMLIFFAFQDGMGDLARLAGLFYPMQIILFANAYSYFKDKKKGILAILATLFVFSYFTYKWTGIGSGYFFKETCVPYKTVFDYNFPN